MEERGIRIISDRRANKKKQLFITSDIMRADYDFSKMKGKKNPYIKHLKQPVTIRLDKASVAYFKAMATELGMPYQNLINLYLRDCAINQKKLLLKWAS